MRGCDRLMIIPCGRRGTDGVQHWTGAEAATGDWLLPWE